MFLLIKKGIFNYNIGNKVRNYIKPRTDRKSIQSIAPGSEPPLSKDLLIAKHYLACLETQFF